MAIKEPNIKITSQETRNKIKEISAFGLPNNPSAKGMSPDAIKKAFWAPIFAQGASLLEEMDRITTDINNYLSTVCQHIGNGDVESIDQEYKDFVKSGESGLTGLSNATWRMLKDIVQRFNANAQEMASRVAEAATYAENASKSVENAKEQADIAQGFAEDAEVSATAAEDSEQSAAEHDARALERANAANASANAAQSYAESALTWYQYAKSEAEKIVNGMKLTKSITCLSRINSNGKIVMGVTVSGTQPLGTDDMVYLSEYKADVSWGTSELFVPLFQQIFSCRLVEIMIENSYTSAPETTLKDSYLYIERVGGGKRMAPYSTSIPNDGGGNGSTRIICAKKTNADGTTDIKYYLKLAASFATCIRETLALTGEDGSLKYPILYITFKGYD